MPDHFFVYPAYLRKKGSRREGRRVGAEAAVGEVTTEQIVEAARRLGYQAVAEAEHHYPRQAHLFEGRVRITKKGDVTKSGFLRDLARVLRELPPPERRT